MATQGPWQLGHLSAALGKQSGCGLFDPKDDIEVTRIVQLLSSLTMVAAAGTIEDANL